MRIERFKVSSLLFGSKMEVGTSLVQYALKMHDHIERLDQLGFWMDFELSLGLILARLPNGFEQFVLDYEMDHIIPTIPELIHVLKIAKGKISKNKRQRDYPERDLLLLWSS